MLRSIVLIASMTNSKVGIKKLDSCVNIDSPCSPTQHPTKTGLEEKLNSLASLKVQGHSFAKHVPSLDEFAINMPVLNTEQGLSRWAEVNKKINIIYIP